MGQLKQHHSLETHYKYVLGEAGCDEAGRGCLAGPVVAAAVMLPKNYAHPLLNDSKQVSKKNRDILRENIMRDARSWGIGIVSPKEIDEINILNASFLAMHRAIDQLKKRPKLLLIDGNRFNPYPDLPHECMIKGDARFLSIAAASILAKTERDAIMTKLSAEFPHYGWESNAGYPTKKHRAAIKEHGSCNQHRKSFQLLPAQLKLDV